MSRIKIFLKSGEIKIFEEARSHLGYSNKLSTEGNLAVVTDPFRKKTYFPFENIEHIEEFPENY